MTRFAKAMELALRGSPEQVRQQVGRVLRVAAEHQPEVAKKVAVHTMRRTGASFRRSAAGWTSLDLLVDELPRSMALPELRAPEPTTPGLSLFLNGVLDLRVAFRKGPMFAEFAEKIADGIFQLALAEPIAHHGARDPERWEAVLLLAGRGDPEPLETLMGEAVHEPQVREDLMSSLRHVAWSFDVGGTV